MRMSMRRLSNDQIVSVRTPCSRKKKEEKKEEKTSECTGELTEGLGVGDSIDQRHISKKSCHYHRLVKGAPILETKQKAKLNKFGTQEE